MHLKIFLRKFLSPRQTGPWHGDAAVHIARHQARLIGKDSLELPKALCLFEVPVVGAAYESRHGLFVHKVRVVPGPPSAILGVAALEHRTDNIDLVRSFCPVRVERDRRTVVPAGEYYLFE